MPDGFSHYILSKPLAIWNSWLRDHTFKTWTCWGSKICQICRRIVLINCRSRGVGVENLWKFAHVLNGWSLITEAHLHLLFSPETLDEVLVQILMLSVFLDKRIMLWWYFLTSLFRISIWKADDIRIFL